MKKIKKLVVVAVATAMMASMSVSASAYTMEQASKLDWGTTTVESKLTNNEVLINALSTQLGLDASKLGKVQEIANAIPAISQDQADAAVIGLQGLLNKTANMTDDEIMDQAVDLVAEANATMGASLNLYFKISTKDKIITIKDRTAAGLGGDKDYGTMTLDEVKKIKGDTPKETLVNKVNDKTVQDSVSKALVAVSGNKGGNKETVTVSNWDNFTESEKQAFVDTMTKAEELDAILKEGKENNGADLAAKMAELKEVIKNMEPGALKDKLQSIVDDYEKEYGAFEAGKTYVLKEENGITDKINGAAGKVDTGSANTTGNKFQATNGTLKKTATNNGNMAVAGLAMIAVAGTVFVVSKKKIAE